MVRITRILCPVDFSDCSRQALAYAAALGKWHDASVTALHVFNDLPVVDPVPLYRGQPLMLQATDPEAVRNRLTAIVSSIATAVPIATEIVDGANVASETLRFAQIISADLIVLGTHGRSGIQRVLLGSVAEKIVRRAACPVILIPPGSQDTMPLPVPFTRIVCGVDFADAGRSAFGLALELAEEADAHLTLVHTLEVAPDLQTAHHADRHNVAALRAAAEADARQRLRGMVPDEARSYCQVHTDVRDGRAEHAILAAAVEREATLIVLGVHDGNILDRLVLGSTLHGVVRGARCPILTLRQGLIGQHAAAA